MEFTLVTLDKNVYDHKETIINNILIRLNEFKNFTYTDWYNNAANDLIAIMHKYKDVDYPKVCAVCSALSPGNSWLSNVKETDQIFRELYLNEYDFSYQTYGANVAKARAIATMVNPTRGELLECFKASKTNHFFRSLLDPLQEAFCIDRHMLTVAGLQSKNFPTKMQFDFIIECYRIAHRKSPVLIQFGPKLQAFVWCAYQHYYKQVRHY